MVDRDGLRDARSHHSRRIWRLARRLPDRIPAYEALLPHTLRPGPARRARGVERTSAVADRTRAARKASAAALAGAARRRIIRSIGEPDDRSVVTFVRLIRPVLEIVGEEPPLGRMATARRVGEILDVDTSPVVRVLRLRDEPAGLMEIEIQDLFASYLDCLTRVVEAVDNL